MLLLHALLKVLVLLLFSFFIDSFKKWWLRFDSRRRCGLSYCRLIFFGTLTASTAASFADTLNSSLTPCLLPLELHFFSLFWLFSYFHLRFTLRNGSCFSSMLTDFSGDSYGCLDDFRRRCVLYFFRCRNRRGRWLADRSRFPRLRVYKVDTSGIIV